MITLVHLYPQHMNLYGDRGNVLTLYQRASWRGLSIRVISCNPGESFDPDEADILFIGGGQDQQQYKVSQDLISLKAPLIHHAIANGAVMLGICGGYQLMGHYYQPHAGEKLQGLGVLDCHTIAGSERLIGNIQIKRPDGSHVLGFENHSGLTYLGENASPLGTVLQGAGNNNQDSTEGAVSGNLYGSYLHGSLLPKNSALADELLLKALQKRQGAEATLSKLINTLEEKASGRAAALSR
jgi:lipid II isoglutaminyl synthase (glutamine-hydrolysing)